MKKKIFLLILVSLSLLLAESALAVGTSTGALTPADLKFGKIPKAQTAAAQVTSTINLVKKVAAGAIARCPVIESKIQIKVSGFDNSKVRHMQAYQTLKDKLSAMSDRLVTRGVDVTALKAALAVLDTKIKKFSDDYAAYVALLKQGQESVCGQSAGQFKAKLKEAQTALKTVNADVLDIRAYYNTAIKAEIAKIRIAIKAMSGGASTSSPAAPQSALPGQDQTESTATNALTQ
ncbi:MAG: hypothetical protein WC668_02355 [Patescibacteria group bacterium]|jgi:hypothetical protein